MKVNVKDIATGVLFIAFGVFYGAIALQTLPIGRALNMGPGYFPTILSGFMIVIGAVIAIRSFATPDTTGFGIVPWRGVIMLSLSTIVFAAFLRQLGLLPGVFVTAMVASMASSQIRLRTALLVSASIAIFCTIIFGYGIKLPIPIFGTWFGG